LALEQNIDDAAACELGLVLELGDDVRQLDVVFVDGGVGAFSPVFLGRYAALADFQPGLAEACAGFGDGLGIADILRAILDQLGVVEFDAVGGLVLDRPPLSGPG